MGIFYDTDVRLAKKFLLRGLPTTLIINKDGKEFSYSRLADILEENLSMSATELNRSILDQVERFSGRTDYDDDLTMITIKCADAAAATEIAPVSDESKA